MVKGYCRINDDRLFGIKWPKQFAEIPRRGQRVQSECRKHIRYVSNITHMVDPKSLSGEPMIEVELCSFQEIDWDRVTN